MDLILLIVLMIAGFLVYYLIDTVRLLQKEIREVKNKCITTRNSTLEDFKENTPDPLINIPNNIINTLNTMKTLFG